MIPLFLRGLLSPSRGEEGQPEGVWEAADADGGWPDLLCGRDHPSSQLRKPKNEALLSCLCSTDPSSLRLLPTVCTQTRAVPSSTEWPEGRCPFWDKDVLSYSDLNTADFSCPGGVAVLGCGHPEWGFPFLLEALPAFLVYLVSWKILRLLLPFSPSAPLPRPSLPPPHPVPAQGPEFSVTRRLHRGA